jgi:hypothetical protein
MDYSFIISQVRTFFRLRHDGYTHRHYSSPLSMVSKPCLDLIKKGDHDIIGASIFWGNIVTRKDTVCFWVRQARIIQPKLKN